MVDDLLSCQSFISIFVAGFHQMKSFIICISSEIRIKLKFNKYKSRWLLKIPSK